MFKNMFAFLTADYDVPTTDFEKTYFDNIEKFAFYNALNEKCVENCGADIKALIAKGDYKAVVANMLNADGLNYGQLPKGLLLFHNYPEGPRTPMEEHLVEGALYAASNGEANVHFTVSHEHMALFEKKVEEKKDGYAQKYGIKYNISKNIDNVVPDRLKQETVDYKQVIAGVLVTLQKKAFGYLKVLDTGNYDHEQLEEMIRFVQRDLCCRKSDIKLLEDAELVIYLRNKLNRPMRVCGVVKNVGEPGGGPFLTYNQDGTVSLQILESSQIDKSNAEYQKMFTEGTHFNPVDLVCAVKDYQGKTFDLPKFVDKTTGFISSKSKSGKELRALELPGLWNGAMSNWSTVFVEVPLGTFNPVKTVNDLLRDQHQ